MLEGAFGSARGITFTIVAAAPLILGGMAIVAVKPGHTLVVTRDEVDHWIDLPADLAQHVM